MSYPLCTNTNALDNYYASLSDAFTIITMRGRKCNLPTASVEEDRRRPCEQITPLVHDVSPISSADSIVFMPGEAQEMHVRKGVVSLASLRHKAFPCEGSVQRHVLTPVRGVGVS